MKKLMGINVPLNLAHASMLQRPISTDCNSDGIPISSRRNPETISKKHRVPKTPRQEKYLQRYSPSHSPLPPFTTPFSRLIARILLAFTLPPTSFIMHYFYLFVFWKSSLQQMSPILCKDRTWNDFLAKEEQKAPPIQRQISCNIQNDKKLRVNANIYSI